MNEVLTFGLDLEGFIQGTLVLPFPSVWSYGLAEDGGRMGIQP